MSKHTILGTLLEVEMWKKCTPLWRKARLEVKMYKTPDARTIFGRPNVEIVHAVVAQSMFGRQKYRKKTGGFGPFLMCQMSFY